MTIYGLDVSNHQGNLTGFGGVATSFLVHKLTEGTTYTDPYAAGNLTFARNHKVPVLGGYHYVRAGNGSGQADYFADRARALFGHDLRGYLWQLDCEDDATWADVKAFKAQWDKGTGAPILFYTGDWWLQPRGWNVASLGFAGLWSAPNRGYVGKAQNVRAEDWTAGWGGFNKITIVQYDARSAIGDTNQFNATLAELKALCAGGTAAAGTSKESDTMQLVETSLQLTKAQRLTMNDKYIVNWDTENADPAHQHADTTPARPQGYPGFVPAFDAYVNGTLTVRLTGHRPGDMLQIRLIKNRWDDKAGKAKPNPPTEVLYDQAMSTGTHWASIPFRAYAHAGEHWYVDVCVYPFYGAGDGDSDRPHLTLEAATLRPWQLRQ